MLGWIAKGGRALWKRAGNTRADDIAKGASETANKIKDAPLRATVAAGNVLAGRKGRRKIMVERALGRAFSESLKERAGKRIGVTTSQARNPDKLVRKAIVGGCDALVIGADKLGAAKKARSRSTLMLCAMEGTRRGGKRQAGEDAAQALEALTKGRAGADVGVFRGQGTWMETPGPRASLPDWLQTLEPIAKWAAGLGGALSWIGLGKDGPQGSSLGTFGTAGSDPMDLIGQGTEPGAASAASDLQASETPKPKTQATRAPELQAALKATGAERAEVEDALAALPPSQNATAEAAAVGMNAKSSQPVQRGQAPLGSGDGSALRQAPTQRRAKRKATQSER